jgi:hypothetical protein
MKKQLLLGLIAIMVGFSACKKDIAKAPETTPANAKQKVNVAAPNYVELQPYPNQPGTYFAPYGGVTLIVNNLYYDNIQYPTVIEGVPAYGTLSIMNANSQSSLNISTDPTVGALFTVNIVNQVFTNYATLRADIQKYNAALSSFLKSGSTTPYPFPSDFIKLTYSSPTGSVTTTPGRLICLTTGSHWAIATNDYVPPAPVIPVNLNLDQTVAMSFVYPAGSVYEYDLVAKNGSIVSISGLNQSTYQSFSISSFSGGTYTPVTGSPGVYLIKNLTVTPQNGASFTFTGHTSDAF